METMAPSMHFPREPANYDEVAMQQSILFSDSLKGLKDLSKQLYSAAEYFELSYTNDDQKNVVVKTLKDYAIKALVNTVDHLGSVSYKVNDLFDGKVNDMMGTELRVSCIEQRLRTCQDYIDREGLTQQSLVIDTPKYHKRYILPGGEFVDDAICSKPKYNGSNIGDPDDWLQLKNAIRATIKETPTLISKGNLPPRNPKISQQSGSFSFSYSMPNKNFERSISPNRFPLLRTGSLSSKTSTPICLNKSRPTTPVGKQMNISEPQKSASMRIRVGKDSPKDNDHNPSKSKRLLKSLLSRRKSKKDDTLYTYLDEY